MQNDIQPDREYEATAGRPVLNSKLGTLLIVYHRPFWRHPDGSLWEREGAFSRYVESLAPHFHSVLVAAPLAQPWAGGGHRLEAGNVRLVPLPFFDSLPAFYRVLPMLLTRLWRALGRADLVNLRLPTPAGFWTFWLARLRRRPVFLLVVGDLAGVAASVPPNNLKRLLFRAYVWLEERLLRIMIDRSLTVTNGHALYKRYAAPGRCIFETQNSTIRSSDVARPRDAVHPPRARLLCVSRIDPRKGLRFLPTAVAAVREHGFEPILDVLGPTVGRLGQDEKAAALAAASRLGLADAIRFRGTASLEEVYDAYTDHDVLLVPSLPGEGIPRVLFEAMAAGLPVVATNVAGIPDVVQEGRSGLLVAPGNGRAMGDAAARLLEDADLRTACVAGGYATARAHTAEAQAAWLTSLLRDHCRAQSSAASRLRSSRRPRVSIPLAGLNLSGGVISLLLLANRLAERGAVVRLLVPDYAAKVPVQMDRRVELRVASTVGGGRIRQLAYFLWLAGQAAAEADIVLANYFLTVYPAVASWLLHGRRAALAYNVRGYEPWSHGLMAPAGRISRYLRFGLAWLSYRLPLSKIVTTHWLKDMVGDDAAVVVGHGIDLETFHPRRTSEPPSFSDPPVVGVIGRLGKVKGYPDFLKATAVLAAEPDIRFLVARLDPVPLPPSRRTQVVEPRTEAAMADFYHRCDVFVFPSLAEGFGLPALEAMACGCAVITTECGGVSTFAQPGQNCLMVPPGQPKLLAAAISRLTSEPQQRARLAQAGVETARMFDRDASLDRLAAAVLALGSEPSTHGGGA
jgi:glycosyltransferase involved in cell wall biosynthesis